MRHRHLSSYIQNIEIVRVTCILGRFLRKYVVGVEKSIFVYHSCKGEGKVFLKILPHHCLEFVKRSAFC